MKSGSYVSPPRKVRASSTDWRESTGPREGQKVITRTVTPKGHTFTAQQARRRLMWGV